MTVRYSHPPEDDHGGVLLADHLEDVANRVEYIVPEGTTTPSGEPLRDVVRTLAYVHDFGKATRFFQQYLGVMDGSPDSPLHRYHAPVGAFAAYYALDAQGFDTETCLAGFVAIGKHHGRLPDVAAYVYDRAHRRKGISGRDQNPAEKQQSAIGDQLADIHENAHDLATSVFENATGGDGDWESFAAGFTERLADIESAVATTGTGPGVDRDALSESCYALVLQCWSALVFADKTSAAGAPNDPATYAATKPTLEQLNAHVRDLEANTSADPEGTRTEQLNYHRSRAHEEVLENTAAFAAEGGGVATLTLPTGMGKTLTGLSAALDLRDRLGGERVVYALPFTSVIDQVVDEVEDIYETDTAGRLLTAHHHLAETTIRDETERDADDADQDDDVSAMLAESWRAGLTVTTFVQLFESLAGPRNRQSMKLPALRDSVVVLDEPQSLPISWWKLAPRLVELLTEEYGATVVAMTATQPDLFEDETELVDDPDSYFDAVERVSYELDSSAEQYVGAEAAKNPEPKSYDDAAATLRSAVDDGDSTLAVCNTIDSARELTRRVRDGRRTTDVGNVYTDYLQAVGSPDAVDIDELADRVERSGERAVLHLSTRLRPADRLTLVEAAKTLTSRGHALLAVTTQLVEAGVDISFDRVYRDLAPMDSIVQAAGRCNRSFERERGRVTVWWLGAPDDQEKTPAEAVYNRKTSLLPVTAAALRETREEQGALTERAVARDAVENYYYRLHEHRNVGEQAYADYVDAAKAGELGELSLIDQRRAADIFVCRTDADRDLVERIRTADREYDFDELRQLLDQTKPLRVSVPVYPHDEETKDAITNLPPILKDEGLYQLDVREYGSYFDETTGFVVPESTVDHQFL